MSRRVFQTAWEKQGNTAWVACPDCANWFPVSQDLIDNQYCDLVCPKCAQAFKVLEAGDMVSSS